MEEVKRYDPDCEGGMLLAHDGDFVPYTDYAALKARVADYERMEEQDADLLMARDETIASLRAQLDAEKALGTDVQNRLVESLRIQLAHTEAQLEAASNKASEFEAHYLNERNRTDELTAQLEASNMRLTAYKAATALTEEYFQLTAQPDGARLREAVKVGKEMMRQMLHGWATGRGVDQAEWEATCDKWDAICDKALSAAPAREDGVRALLQAWVDWYAAEDSKGFKTPPWAQSVSALDILKRGDK